MMVACQLNYICQLDLRLIPYFWSWDGVLGAGNLQPLVVKITLAEFSARLYEICPQNYWSFEIWVYNC